VITGTPNTFSFLTTESGLFLTTESGTFLTT
jgi:hypothetical protein